MAAPAPLSQCWYVKHQETQRRTVVQRPSRLPPKSYAIGRVLRWSPLQWHKSWVIRFVLLMFFFFCFQVFSPSFLFLGFESATLSDGAVSFALPSTSFFFLALRFVFIYLLIYFPHSSLLNTKIGTSHSSSDVSSTEHQLEGIFLRPRLHALVWMCTQMIVIGSTAHYIHQFLCFSNSEYR